MRVNARMVSLRACANLPHQTARAADDCRDDCNARLVPMFPAGTVMTSGQLLPQSFRDHVRNAVHSAAYGDSSRLPGSESEPQIADSFFHVSSFERPIKWTCENGESAQCAQSVRQADTLDNRSTRMEFAGLTGGGWRAAGNLQLTDRAGGGVARRWSLAGRGKIPKGAAQ
jgi:hypothetical protein